MDIPVPWVEKNIITQTCLLSLHRVLTFNTDTDTNTVQHSEVVKCQPRPRPYSRRRPNHNLPTHCKPVLKLQHSRTDNSQCRQDLVWRHLGLLSYIFIGLLNNEVRSQMNFTIRLKCWIWQYKKFS